MKKTLFYLALLSIFSLVYSCSNDKTSSNHSESSMIQKGKTEKGKPVVKPVSNATTVPVREKGFTYASIKTDYGTMVVKLYNSTPKHRDNFIKLANEHFYDGLLFHRIIPNFMIQGGDPKSKDAAAGVRLGSGGPGYTIDAEIGALHYKGALAAARKGGPSNLAKKSSGSQFYIVQGKPVTQAMLTSIEQRNGIKYTEDQRAKYLKVGGTPFLDNLYTVYGEITEGMDVLDKISAVKTDKSDRPLKDIKMEISIVK